MDFFFKHIIPFCKYGTGYLWVLNWSCESFFFFNLQFDREREDILSDFKNSSQNDTDNFTRR